MQMFIQSARWFAATLFLAGSLSVARAAVGIAPETALAPPDRAPQPLTPQEQSLLQRFDTNHDGKLEPQELAAAHGYMQTQFVHREAMARQIYDKLLEKFDADHSGKLTDAEQVEALAYLKASNPKIYARIALQFGRTGGDLNPAQRAALFQYLGNLPPELGKFSEEMPTSIGSPPAGERVAAHARPGAQLYARLLERFDHEHKGSLTPAEESQAVQYLSANQPQVYQRLLDIFDTNGYGYLDQVETAAMFEKLARAYEAQQVAMTRGGGPAQ